MARPKQTRPAIRTYTELSSYERIYIWYTEDEERRTVKLTQREEDLKEALKVTFGLILEHGDNQEVIARLKDLFDVNDATCYRYIRDAKRLFCDVENLDKEAERFVLLKQLEKGLQIALSEKDTDQINKFLKLKADVLGMTRDDAFMPDWEKVQPVLPVMMFSPALLANFGELPPADELEKELKLLARPKRKNNLNFEGAEDAEVIKE